MPDIPPDSSPVDSFSPTSPRWLLDPRAAGGRLALSAILGAIATALTPSSVEWPARAMVGWDAAALLLCTLAWLNILRCGPAETRRRAALEDPGRRFVFVIAVLASLFSLFAAVVVLKHIRTLPPEHAETWTVLALAAVVLSWTVTHTAFTLRYAHLFYRGRTAAGGLRFPGTDTPCDLDFAYFAFTIGMCFQVSDVTIESWKIRHAVLLHSVISFLYNTTLLALSLTMVTTLLSP
jgi:uncharacterized membrane protein